MFSRPKYRSISVAELIRFQLRCQSVCLEIFPHNKNRRTGRFDIECVTPLTECIMHDLV